MYIPLLPAGMLDFVQAPMPFLMGVHSDCIPSIEIPSSVLVIDLDNDETDGANALPEPADDFHAQLVCSLCQVEEKMNNDIDIVSAFVCSDTLYPLLLPFVLLQGAIDSFSLGKKPVASPLFMWDFLY